MVRETSRSRAVRSRSELFVRDNRDAPSRKMMQAYLRTSDGRLLLIEDRAQDQLQVGRIRRTGLGEFDAQVVHVQVFDTRVGIRTGPPIEVHAPPGRFFRTFQLRWGRHDELTIDFTTAPLN